MARRHEGELGVGGRPVKPWPKDLATFDPDQWRDRVAWHAARAKVAKSLGRSALPEVRAMTRVHRGRNGKVL
jgi:hypothetical protein